MLQNLLKKCLTDNVRAYRVAMPMSIRSYVVRKDDWYTIIVNESLSPEAQVEACGHEVDHINRGDFDSDEPTGLIEIRAHRLSES